MNLSTLFTRHPSPVDIPRVESLALAVPNQPLESTVDRGKSVHDADTAWESNVTAMDELRYRRSTCHECGTQPAAVAVRFRDRTTRRACQPCADRLSRAGNFTIHDGGGAA